MKMSMAPDFRIRDAIVADMNAAAAIYDRETLKHIGLVSCGPFQSEIGK